jgi:uncharacterized protein (DUF305 family)
VHQPDLTKLPGIELMCCPADPSRSLDSELKGTTFMKRILIGGVSVGAVLLLAACGSTSHSSHTGTTSSAGAMPGMSGMSMSTTGGGTAAQLESSTAPSSTQHNAADIMFAQMMIPHHSQAVEMANKEVINGKNAQLTVLAKKIMAAQEPEIVQMNGMLTRWGVAPAGHQGHGSMTSMPGMMSDADMVKFQKATGAAVDRMFASMMIAHHQGAIVMANTEMASGVNTAAKTLAKSIVAAQTAEITQLKQLLATLPS